MDATQTVLELAQSVNEWCDRHGVSPANGQAGERMTERNVRYYRALGLIDAPLTGGGAGYGEKHRLQLIAIRLLQAQGLPLNRIRDLLLGRTQPELEQIEKRGLAELKADGGHAFRPALSENWAVTSLDDEFLLVSRRGRGISPELRERLRAVLRPTSKPRRRVGGVNQRN